MAPKFGTSGLRGLVTELTSDLVADHVRAFLQAVPYGTGLWVGRDLRPSSPDLVKTVLAAARAMGVATVDCGAVPTPALALASMQAGAAAVMVTGSHIPVDRNGLKFYRPDGEISKADERAILTYLGRPVPEAALGPDTRHEIGAGAAWIERYVAAFGSQALSGLRLGVWSHSAVSRDLLLEGLRALGAETVELGRSETFIPVDTEAVSAQTRNALARWAKVGLDAILSTDGDGDRPLLSDAAGRVIPGDILGQITAEVLGAETVATPVSSNTGVEMGARFTRVIRTRIGSPYVIAGMATAKGEKVVGYEANGGFLLGFTAEGPAGPLAPLATRDSLLPLVAPLSRAQAAGGLAALVAREPARFTAADRLEHIAPERSAALLADLTAETAVFADLLGALGEEAMGRDETDGLRLTFASRRVLHLRSSGNAPEFRIYAEAESSQAAVRLLQTAKGKISALFG